MRFLWTYLILVIVFAFGFVCAAVFTVGMTPQGAAPSRRAGDPDIRMGDESGQ